MQRGALTFELWLLDSTTLCLHTQKAMTFRSYYYYEGHYRICHFSTLKKALWHLKLFTCLPLCSLYTHGCNSSVLNFSKNNLNFKSSKCKGRPLMWHPGSCASVLYISKGIENVLVWTGPMTTSKIYSPLSRITGYWTKNIYTSAMTYISHFLVSYYDLL